MRWFVLLLVLFAHLTLAQTEFLNIKSVKRTFGPYNVSNQEIFSDSFRAQAFPEYQNDESLGIISMHSRILDAQGKLVDYSYVNLRQLVVVEVDVDSFPCKNRNSILELGSDFSDVRVPYPFVYFLTSQRRWNYVIELTIANQTQEEIFRTASVELEFQYIEIPVNFTNFLPVSSLWLQTTGCDSITTYSVAKSNYLSELNLKLWDFSFPYDVTLVWTEGIMRAASKRIYLMNLETGKVLLESVPTLRDSNFISMTINQNPIFIEKDAKLRLVSVYNSESSIDDAIGVLYGFAFKGQFKIGQLPKDFSTSDIQKSPVILALAFLVGLAIGFIVIVAIVAVILGLIVKKFEEKIANNSTSGQQA